MIDCEMRGCNFINRENGGISMGSRFVIKNINGEDVVLDKKRNISIPLNEFQEWIGWYKNNNIFNYF